MRLQFIVKVTYVTQTHLYSNELQSADLPAMLKCCLKLAVCGELTSKSCLRPLNKMASVVSVDQAEAGLLFKSLRGKNIYIYIFFFRKFTSRHD